MSKTWGAGIHSVLHVLSSSRTGSAKGHQVVAPNGETSADVMPGMKN